MAIKSAVGGNGPWSRRKEKALGGSPRRLIRSGPNSVVEWIALCSSW